MMKAKLLQLLGHRMYFLMLGMLGMLGGPFLGTSSWTPEWTILKWMMTPGYPHFRTVELTVTWSIFHWFDVPLHKSSHMQFLMEVGIATCPLSNCHFEWGPQAKSLQET